MDYFHYSDCATVSILQFQNLQVTSNFHFHDFSPIYSFTYIQPTETLSVNDTKVLIIRWADTSHVHRSPWKGRQSGAFSGRIVAWNRLIVGQRVPNDGHSVCARLATWHAKITLLLPGTEGLWAKNDWPVIGLRNSRRTRWSCLPVPFTILGDRVGLIQPTKRTFYAGFA